MVQGKSLAKSHVLLPLQPLLDSKSLLCVGGRLENSFLLQCHPILLPKTHPAVDFILLQLHKDNAHAGPSALMDLISAEYYIPGIKSTIKHLLRHCVPCRRCYADTVRQQMGQLPAERVHPAPPFYHTGVDLAGPLFCKRNRARNSPSNKVYVCLYVCLTTKAIHLDLVSETLTAAFLASFQHFCSHRGTPATLWSDNGTNFTGANREIISAYKQIITDDTVDSITKSSFKPPE